MNAFWGADTDQLVQHATAMHTAAQRLVELQEQLSSLVMDEAIWRGSDADSFRERWQSDALQASERVAGDIDTKADEVQGHASEQDGASGGGGIGGALGASGGGGIGAGLGRALGGAAGAASSASGEAASARFSAARPEASTAVPRSRPSATRSGTPRTDADGVTTRGAVTAARGSSARRRSAP